MTHYNDFDKTLLEKVSRYIRENGMEDALHAGRRVGVALSGGADSMALLDISLTLGLHPIALHCNFRLRGHESDRDEQFVTDYCARKGVELLTLHPDVAGRMALTGESTEMACRELRYNWFSQTADDCCLKAILLGHHSDDNVETFFLNLLRGCGLGGAKGIPPRRGIFMRPLLSLSRREITEYLGHRGIPYVTDSTNSSNDFRRNRLRNIILPATEECFPGAKESILRSIRNLAADHRLLRGLVARMRDSYTDGSDGRICVGRLFSEEPEAATLLYHILDGDLDEGAIRNIRASIGESGKFFTGRSGTRYLLDRGILIPVSNATGNTACNRNYAYRLRITREKMTQGYICIKIPNEQTELHIRMIPLSEFTPRRDPEFAWFDQTILDVPTGMMLRHPHEGDRIIPFGMSGSTLLSDIFSDHKVPVTEKPRQWVLTAGEHIVWVPGHKTSCHHRVTPLSENILEFHIVKTGENL